ncbi:MAG: HAD family hydrolase [Bryobacteraceae bacterium]
MVSKSLVLFDIDGTLMRRAGPHHRQALVDAVRDVTGMETSLDHIPLHGMLDPDILSRMMHDAGASPALVCEAMSAVVERAQYLYDLSCPDLQEKLCPGVCQLLSELRKRKVPLALVTGNLTRIGWKKMERAGLKPFFLYGAFGEMAADRAGLARMAIQRARSEGWIGEEARISLVGDSPNDVIAARANNIQAIAVRTGVSEVEDLVAESPDLLLEDLRELRFEMLL